MTVGSYTVTVTDANGCTATATAKIVGPAAELSANISDQKNVSCFGGADGSATVKVTGGTSDYTYRWDTIPVQNSPTATGLAVGSYTVLVTDANGCSVASTVMITGPAAELLVSISRQNNVSCFGGADGSATVRVTGGTSGYTYSWDTIPVQNSPTATGLTVGIYSVTVTDANGCAARATAEIAGPAAELSVNVSDQHDVSCFGNADGSVTVRASGGTANYIYKWDTTPPQIGPRALSLPPGTYTVTVTDANGCTATASATITGSSSELAMTLCVPTRVSSPGCSDGMLVADVSGGTMPYVFQIDGGIFQSSNHFRGVAEGVHTITVKDARNCLTSARVTISEPFAHSSTRQMEQTEQDSIGVEIATAKASGEKMTRSARISKAQPGSPASIGSTASGRTIRAHSDHN